jgi:hypothetical protein
MAKYDIGPLALAVQTYPWQVPLILQEHLVAVVQLQR